MHNYLDFEKPVADLEGQILELKKIEGEDDAVDVHEEIARLETRPGRRPRSPAIPTGLTAPITSSD